MYTERDRGGELSPLLLRSLILIYSPRWTEKLTLLVTSDDLGLCMDLLQTELGSLYLLLRFQTYYYYSQRQQLQLWSAIQVMWIQRSSVTLVERPERWSWEDLGQDSRALSQQRQPCSTRSENYTEYRWSYQIHLHQTRKLVKGLGCRLFEKWLTISRFHLSFLTPPSPHFWAWKTGREEFVRTVH